MLATKALKAKWQSRFGGSCAREGDAALQAGTALLALCGFSGGYPDFGSFKGKPKGKPPFWRGPQKKTRPSGVQSQSLSLIPKGVARSVFQCTWRRIGDPFEQLSANPIEQRLSVGGDSVTVPCFGWFPATFTIDRKPVANSITLPPTNMEVHKAPFQE